MRNAILANLAGVSNEHDTSQGATTMLIKLPQTLDKTTSRKVYDEMIDAASIDGYVILDGSHVETIDVFGARTLLDGFCFSGIVGAEFELASASDTMRAFLELTRLSNILPVGETAPTLEEKERRDRSVVARFVGGLFLIGVAISVVIMFSGID